MNIDDVNLNVEGFEPDQKTRHQLINYLRLIYEEAPYGSTLTANYSKNLGQYKGEIKVSSSEQSFYSIAKGQDLEEVAAFMRNELRQQILKWKTSRFPKNESPEESNL